MWLKYGQLFRPPKTALCGYKNNHSASAHAFINIKIQFLEYQLIKITIGSTFVAFIFLEICKFKVKSSRFEKFQKNFQRWNRICVSISELSPILIWFTWPFILTNSYINYIFRRVIRHVKIAGKCRVAVFSVAAGDKINSKSR